MVPQKEKLGFFRAPVLCAVCFGDKASNMVRSLWPGMYLLLGLIALVLGAIAYLGFTWMRREDRQAGSL